MPEHTEELDQETLEGIQAWGAFEAAAAKELDDIAVAIIDTDPNTVIFFDHPDKDENAPHGINKPEEMEVTDADPITD